MIRFLAASAQWCSVSGVNASAPSNGIMPNGAVDFLFNQHLNRIVWHSHTFLPGWCRVVKWRGGLGSLFNGDKEQQTVVFLPPGLCAVFVVPIFPEFHVTGMNPSRQIVLSITGDPCNVRRAGFFGGRELSPSQCSIDVTELWDAPPGGASGALYKRIDTQRLCYQFPSSHQ